MHPVINRHAVGLYIFVTGVAAGLAQVVLFRELLVIATGTELVIGLLLGVWLVGAAMGSTWAEGGRSYPLASARRAWRLAWLVGPSLAFGVLVVRAARPLLATIPTAIAAHLPSGGKLSYLLERVIAVQPGEALGLVHIVVIGLTATLGAAFCCGAQFVTGARLLGGEDSAGKAYALDAFGHLVGGVALAFAAALWLDGLWVAAAAGVGAVAAGWHVLPGPKTGEARVAVAGLAAIVVAGVVLASPSRRWRWPVARVLTERASVYGLVTIAEQKGGGVYFFENGVPSGESPPTPTMQVLVNFALAQVPQPRRVLLIGGGVSGGVAEALKHNPSHVDYVEFDPVYLALARQWAADVDRKAMNDPRVTCVACDPRLFLRRAEHSYDAIIIALPAPTTALLNRFFTVEWFAMCWKRLSDDGVVAFDLPYSQVYRSEVLGQLDRCIAQAAGILSAQGASATILAGMDALTVVARPGAGTYPLTRSPDELISRLAARSVDAPYLQAYVWDWMDRQNLGQAWELLSGPTIPNRDLQPGGYLLGTAYWLAQITPTVGSWLSGLIQRAAPPVPQLLPLLLVAPGLLAALAALCAPRALGRLGAWMFMATAGIAGMAMELAVIFLLQVSYGYVYGLIGVVTGGFMIGLALGALAVEIGPWRRMVRGAIAFMAALGAGAVVWPLVSTAEALAVWAFPVLSLLAGVYVGVAFPVAVRAWGAGARGGHHGVGVIYAADLLGGVVAALIVPGVLIPLSGLAVTAFVTAIAVAPFFALFGWSRRGPGPRGGRTPRSPVSAGTDIRAG